MSMQNDSPGGVVSHHHLVIRSCSVLSCDTDTGSEIVVNQDIKAFAQDVSNLRILWSKNKEKDKDDNGNGAKLAPFTVTLQTRGVCHLLFLIEMMLCDGLQDVLFFSNTTFWDFLKNLPNCMPGTEQFIKQVSAMAPSSLGRGRLFISESLNQKLCHSYVSSLFWDQKRVREFYKPKAFLRSEPNQETFLENLEYLTDIDFNIRFSDVQSLAKKDFWASLDLSPVVITADKVLPKELAALQLLPSPEQERPREINNPEPQGKELGTSKRLSGDGFSFQTLSSSIIQQVQQGVQHVQQQLEIIEQHEQQQRHRILKRQQEQLQREQERERERQLRKTSDGSEDKSEAKEGEECPIVATSPFSMPSLDTLTTFQPQALIQNFFHTPPSSPRTSAMGDKRIEFFLDSPQKTVFIERPSLGEFDEADITEMSKHPVLRHFDSQIQMEIDESGGLTVYGDRANYICNAFEDILSYGFNSNSFWAQRTPWTWIEERLVFVLPPLPFTIAFHRQNIGADNATPKKNEHGEGAERAAIPLGSGPAGLGGLGSAALDVIEGLVSHEQDSQPRPAGNVVEGTEGVQVGGGAHLLSYIHSLHQVNSPIGMLRAFIRLALNEGKLREIFLYLFCDPIFTNYFLPGAVLYSTLGRETTLRIAEKLEKLKFSVVIDNYEFDYGGFYQLKMEAARTVATSVMLEEPREVKKKEVGKGDGEEVQVLGRSSKSRHKQPATKISRKKVVRSIAFDDEHGEERVEEKQGIFKKSQEKAGKEYNVQPEERRDEDREQPGDTHEVPTEETLQSQEKQEPDEPTELLGGIPDQSEKDEEVTEKEAEVRDMVSEASHETLINIIDKSPGIVTEIAEPEDVTEAENDTTPISEIDLAGQTDEKTGTPEFLPTEAGREIDEPETVIDQKLEADTNVGAEEIEYQEIPEAAGQKDVEIHKEQPKELVRYFATELEEIERLLDETGEIEEPLAITDAEVVELDPSKKVQDGEVNEESEPEIEPGEMEGPKAKQEDEKPLQENENTLEALREAILLTASERVITFEVPEKFVEELAEQQPEISTASVDTNKLQDVAGEVEPTPNISTEIPETIPEIEMDRETQTPDMVAITNFPPDRPNRLSLPSPTPIEFNIEPESREDKEPEFASVPLPPPGRPSLPPPHPSSSPSHQPTPATQPLASISIGRRVSRPQPPPPTSTPTTIPAPPIPSLRPTTYFSPPVTSAPPPPPFTASKYLNTMPIITPTATSTTPIQTSTDTAATSFLMNNAGTGMDTDMDVGSDRDGEDPFEIGDSFRNLTSIRESSYSDDILSILLGFSDTDNSNTDNESCRNSPFTSFSPFSSIDRRNTVTRTQRRQPSLSKDLGSVKERKETNSASQGITLNLIENYVPDRKFLIITGHRVIPTYSITDEDLDYTKNDWDRYVESKRDIFDLNLYIKTTPSSECHSCGFSLEPSNGFSLFDKSLFCFYTGKYYCSACHMKETSVIPAYVIREWNFSQFPVCTSALEHIKKHWKNPLFHVRAENQSLYQIDSALAKSRVLRAQATQIAQYLRSCKVGKKLFGPVSNAMYLVDSVHVYSLNDLVAVHNNKLVPLLTDYLRRCLHHITTNCESCKGKGDLCELCHSKKPFFRFQWSKIKTCPACSTPFHTACYAQYNVGNSFDLPNPGCPKCHRLWKIQQSKIMSI